MTRNTFRDDFLDVAKGLAIILVVIGHVIQGSSAQFDDLLWFRVIYSFHMPLFVFLSGAVAAIAFRAEWVQDGVRAAINLAKVKISKAALRLLLPFVAWCVINQLVYQHSDTVLGALILAFRRPDTALWFLLAIFYCIALVSLFDIVFAAIYQLLAKDGLRKISKFIADGRVQIILMILIWWAIREHTPRGAGLSLIRPYFVYYLLGMGFYKYLYPIIDTWKYLPAWIIFIALIPFWSRTAPDNIGNIATFDYIPGLLIYFYAGIVALSGSFLIISLAKMLTSSNFKWIKKFLILCGQLSLGIYALHYFFLSYSPKVLMSLLASFGLTYVINQISVLRTVLLGEKSG